MKLADREFKLNDIVELGFINENNCWKLVMGRYFNDDLNYVYLDISETFIELDDTIKIKKDKVKYARKVDQNLWR